MLSAAALWALGFGPATSPIVFNGVMLVVLVVFSFACIAQGDAAEARWGKDPSNAVADETAGQCIPLLFLPASATATLPAAAFTLAFAFLAFRILDIVKPWPARGLQKLPAGWGILIDDLFAGLYAAAVVQIDRRSPPHAGRAVP